MEFFDMLGKKATMAYKVTADKTGKIAKETKLKFKIGDLRSKINELYEEIGKKVYEQHIREEDYSIKEDLEELCTKIDVLSDEIDTCLKKCLELKDKKQCPKCFAEIEKGCNFCPECGEKQTDSKPQEVEILEDLENANVEEKNQNEKEIVEEELKEDIKQKEDYKNEYIQEDEKVEKNNDTEKNKKKINKEHEKDLQRTVEIETDPKIKPGENDQYIKMEEQDPLDD